MLKNKINNYNKLIILKRKIEKNQLTTLKRNINNNNKLTILKRKIEKEETETIKYYNMFFIIGLFVLPLAIGFKNSTFITLIMTTLISIFIFLIVKRNKMKKEKINLFDNLKLENAKHYEERVKEDTIDLILYEKEVYGKIIK